MKSSRPALGSDERLRTGGATELEKLLGAAALARLPRFLVLGAPGAGKSAALEAAGFGRAPSDEEASDWVCWPGERMVAVEAPGRLLQAGKMTAADRKSWKARLAALQASRPARPLDGVVAMLRLPVSTRGDSARAEAQAFRALIGETETLLGTKLPCAVLFTHADRIPGFVEFFGPDGAAGRDAPFGEWLPDPRPYASAWAEAAFGRLCGRLRAVAPDRIEAAGDRPSRAAAFAFPAAFASARTAVLETLAELAGGSPAIPVLGFGFASASGPSAFLRDLFTTVLPAAAAGQARRRSRRTGWLKSAALAAAAVASVALLAGWSLSFSRERALIAATRQAVTEIGTNFRTVLQVASVSAPDFENVLDVLGALHDLPVGPAFAAEPAGWESRLGLSRRASLSAAAEAAYAQALERLFRPRLMLALHGSVAAGLRQPDELYPPLKAYLMLGGTAPAVDDGLILGWAEQDWDGRYPGSANRGGRAQLMAHLEAMLRLDDGRPPAAPFVDRALVETAQRALARMDMPDRALALIQSAAYSAKLPALSLAAAAGPQGAALFETASGRALSSLAVPGLYTADGFAFFLGQLASVAERLEQDQWVMGAGGQTVGVEERLKRLGPDLLDRYSRAFMTAWTEMLGELRLKPLSVDEPDYAALAAAAAADSPLRRLVEIVAAETGVTAADAGLDGSGKAAEGLARIGIAPPSAKSQNRAGNVFSAGFTSPGAAIEARFRPYRMLVAGEPGLRPIDILVRNLADIRQSLQAGDGARSGRLQLQVLNLRTNASRLPPPLSGMLQTAADAFESEVVEASISQLDQQIEDMIGSACRTALADAFPFGKAGSRDLPLSDFARLFGPNGEFDRFFAQNLAALVDITGGEWRWRPDIRLGRDLSAEVLRSFQRAAEIRDAFFRAGSSTPGVSLTFTPISLGKDAETALLDINGSLIHAYPDGNVPASVTWPESGTEGAASLALTPALPGRQSALRFEGPWALLRLVAAGTRSVTGGAAEIRFIVGGRDVAFTVTSDARLNLFALPLLEEFKCPSGL